MLISCSMPLSMVSTSIVLLTAGSVSELAVKIVYECRFSQTASIDAPLWEYTLSTSVANEATSMNAS